MVLFLSALVASVSSLLVINSNNNYFCIWLSHSWLMTYYKHKKNYKRRNYYGYLPKNAVISTNPLPRIQSTPPVKPKYSDAEISEKAFLKYETHPNRAKRHRKYSFGWPIAVVYMVSIISLLLFVLSHYELPIRIILLCFVATFILLYLPAHFEDLNKEVKSYDKYKDLLKEYEEKQKEYETYLRKKQEEEQLQIKKKNDLIRFINGTGGKEYLSKCGKKLKSFDVYKIRSQAEWREMSYQAFEHEVADVFRKLGYLTKVTKQSSDGGVDIILSKNGQTSYVQCKHYAPTTPVHVHEIREFFGVCMRSRYNGYFVHTSSLTPDANEFASDSEVKKYLEIVPLEQLMRLEKKGHLDLLEISTATTTSIWFHQEVVNSVLYTDCRYYWLYNRLFDTIELASQTIRSLREWEGMQYAVISERPEGYDLDVYYIVLGVKESIYQLSRKIHIVEVFPGA